MELNLIKVMSYTEPEIMVCMWFGEFCSSCFLPLLTQHPLQHSPNHVQTINSGSVVDLLVNSDTLKVSLNPTIPYLRSKVVTVVLHFKTIGQKLGRSTENNYQPARNKEKLALPSILWNSRSDKSLTSCRSIQMPPLRRHAGWERRKE